MQSVDERGNLRVACVGERDDARTLRFHVGEELQSFFVAQHGGFEGAIDRGEDDERHAIADQGVGAVLELAYRVALGVHVGGFLQLERAFAGDGVVDAAAEVEERYGRCVFRGERGRLLAPCVELRRQVRREAR